MRFAALALLLSVTACTYGPPMDHLSVQNVAIKPDGSRLAVAVKFERYRNPTGLAAFPDGGVPKVLEQRADVYVVSLPQGTVLSRLEVPAPEANRVSFKPWLMGWEGDRVFLRITGCPGQPGDECYGPLIRATVYSVGPDGRVQPDAAPKSASLVSTINEGASYLSAGTEPYGISIGTQPGLPRTPLLRFSAQKLEPVLR